MVQDEVRIFSNKDIETIDYERWRFKHATCLLDNYRVIVDGVWHTVCYCKDCGEFYFDW